MSDWTIKDVPDVTMHTILNYARNENISVAEALTKIVDALEELGGLSESGQ